MNPKQLGKRYWNNLTGKTVKELKANKAKSLANIDSLKKEVSDFADKVNKYSKLEKYFSNLEKELRNSTSELRKRKAKEAFMKMEHHKKINNTYNQVLNDSKDLLKRVEFDHNLKNYDQNIRKAKRARNIARGATGAGVLGLGTGIGLGIKHYKEKQASIYMDAIEKVASINPKQIGKRYLDNLTGEKVKRLSKYKDFDTIREIGVDDLSKALSRSGIRKSNFKPQLLKKPIKKTPIVYVDDELIRQPITLYRSQKENMDRYNKAKKARNITRGVTGAATIGIGTGLGLADERKIK